jgi:hypothetical protein
MHQRRMRWILLETETTIHVGVVSMREFAQGGPASSGDLAHRAALPLPRIGASIWFQAEECWYCASGQACWTRMGSSNLFHSGQ